MESKQTMDSVIARLMGLEELPPRQPIQKKQRVLSENYLRRVASIGVKEKHSEGRSLRSSVNEQEDYNHLFHLSKLSRTSKHNNASFAKRGSHSSSSGLRMRIATQKEVVDSKTDNFHKYCQDPDLLFSVRCNNLRNVPSHLPTTFFTELTSLCPFGRRDIDFYGKSLWKVDNGLRTYSSRKLHLDCMNNFLGSPLESCDGSSSLASRFVVLKPNFEKLDNAASIFSSSTYSHGASYSENQKHKGISSHQNRNYLVEGNKWKNSINDRGPFGSRSRFSKKIAKKLGPGVSSISTEISLSEVLGCNSFETDSFSNVPSPDLSILKSHNCSVANAFGLQDIRHMRALDSIGLIKSKSKKQESDLKGCLERRNSDCSYKNLESFCRGESENNHLVDGKYVILNQLENELEEKNLCSLGSVHTKLSGQNSKTLQDALVTMEGHTSEGRNVDPFKQAREVSMSKLTGVFHSFFEEDSVASQCCGTEPGSPTNLEEAYQPSPNSVLEASYKKEIPSSFDCFSSVCASSHGLEMQLERMESETLDSLSEGSGMMVSSDEDTGEGSIGDSEENEDSTRSFHIDENREFSYLVNVLTLSGLQTTNTDASYDTWQCQDGFLSSSIFEALEKKYGKQVSWKKSERKLLFDRINVGLMEVLQPSMCAPEWTKPVARRFKRDRKQGMIEELWMILVSQEKEATKEKVMGKDEKWLDLEDDIRDIGREIENSLINELMADVISAESF